MLKRKKSPLHMFRAYHKHLQVGAALILGATVALIIWLISSAIPVQPEVPECNFEQATIYVEDGYIVGGNDDGEKYEGKLNGTNFADVIVGTSGDDDIKGKNGDDIICGNGGDDKVDGGNGNDEIYTGSGDDDVKGNNNNDIICTYEGDDKIDGGNGNDKIDADGGDNDKIDGKNGNDVCLNGEDLNKCEFTEYEENFCPDLEEEEPPEEEECAECDGKVTELTLKYNGDEEVEILIEDKKGNTVFEDTVEPGEEFYFEKDDDENSFGSRIRIYIDDDDEYTEIHTSCSEDIGPGSVFGDFEVVEGRSRVGGPLCPIIPPPPPPEEEECAECDGKVTELTLKYNGGEEVEILIEDKKGNIVFEGSVEPGEEFYFEKFIEEDSFGTRIRIYVDEGGDFELLNGDHEEEYTEIHTSCSVDIGPGYVSGDFEVISGESRYGGLLCPIPPPPPPPPPEVLGSIRVCKIILDDEGNVVNGVELEGTNFSISGVESAPNGPVAVGILPTTQFNAPINLAQDLLFDDQTYDASCTIYSELELGGYFYSEETIISGYNVWAPPLYNDQDQTPALNLDHFYPYSNELFTEDDGDDGDRNTDADGHIVLSSGRPDRTLIILNQYEEVPEEISCDPDKELIENGGFELPIVTDSHKWDVYPSGTPNLDWNVEWQLDPTNYKGQIRPEIANLELHRGVKGWSAAEGNQYAELDTDWDGPGGGLNGEPASVRIYQDIATEIDNVYKVSFYYSPRPNTNENNNILEISWDGEIKDTISAPGEGDVDWNYYEYHFVATEETTRLQFADVGTADSLGVFLDEVSVRCDPDFNFCSTVPEIRVDFTRVENSGNGNSTNNYYVGPDADQYASGSVIPLTNGSGDYIVDGGMDESVPGIAFERGVNFIHVVLEGMQSKNDLEIVDNIFTFNEALITGFDNDSGDNKMEKPTDGIYKDKAGQDELFANVGTNQAESYLRTTTANDGFYLYYECQETNYCGDGFLDSGEQCDDGNTEDGDGCNSICEFEEPPEIFGSIKICKIVLDEEGDITDGSLHTGTIFSVDGVNVVPNGPAPVGVLPDTDFTLPLELNTNIIGDSDPDAECVTYGELELGGYYYAEESVNPILPAWAYPLYNDQHSTLIEDLEDFFLYSDELFTVDPEDDPERNTDSDGHIVLTAGRPDRTVVIVNQYSASPEPLRPILECVEMNGEESYTAYFGYMNENNYDLNVPIGSKNKFKPVPKDRGHPTEFSPGRTSFYPNAKFSVPFDGSNLIWKLTGPDGVLRKATASDNEILRCPETDADVGVEKVDLVDPVSYGGNIQYTVTVTNYGPANATNVVAIDTLPVGVTYVSAVPTQGSCSEVAGTVTCDLGNLGLNDTQTIAVVVTPNEPGKYTNNVSVTANEEDLNLDNNEDDEDTDVSPIADLSVDKTDSADPVLLGSDVVYSVLVTNNGPHDSEEVILTDTLPGDVTFVSAVPTQGGCSVLSGTITCNLGTIVSGANASVAITVTPLSTGEINNSAYVTSTTDDPDPENNSDDEDTEVYEEADLSVEKTDVVDPVSLGDDIGYTVVVTNNGPSDAQYVTLGDTLPAGTVFVSAVPSQGSCSELSGVLNCDFGTIANGNTVNISITITPSKTGEYTNIATVTSETYDPNEENNSDSEDTEVNSPPDFDNSLKIEDDEDNQVIRLDRYNYAITLINTGETGATGVDIYDPLDQHLQDLNSVALSNCGDNYTDNSTSTALDITDVEVEVGIQCVISFGVQVTGSAPNAYMIPNTAYISASNEGGQGFEPKSDEVRVAVSGPPPPPPPPRGPICGDGILDSGEECDDGNLVGGDGCSAFCDIEQEDEFISCLDYNPNRQILYTDKLLNWTDVYVDFLSRVYIKIGLVQYIISGDGSYYGDHEKTGETTIRPIALTNRFEAVKIALTANCIQIYQNNERDLFALNNPNATEFDDLSRNPSRFHPDRKFVAEDDFEFILNVLYTALDNGIIHGRVKENGDHDADWKEPVTRAEILKIFINAADLQNIVAETGEEAEALTEDNIPYSDVSIDAWYAPFIPFAHKYRIVAENETMEAFPDRPAVRAEVFALGARILFITSAMEHMNSITGMQTFNEMLRNEIFLQFEDSERNEFLFSVEGFDPYALGLAERD